MISTIIPTWNRPRTLADAVESALAQSYPASSHDIIVVDDGSPDEGATRAALAGFGSRVRYLRKENGGVASARNLGMTHARGTFVAFLDDDDIWAPDKLQRQLDFLSTRPHCGLVGTDFVRVDPEGREIRCSRLGGRLSDDRRNISQALQHPVIPPSAMLVRREVIDEIGGFDTGLRTAEDVDFQLRVAARWGIGIIGEPLLRYRVGHVHGLSHGRSTYWDHTWVIHKHLRRHADVLGPERRREILIHHLLRNGRGLMTGGWYRDGVCFLAAAAAHGRSMSDALGVAGLSAVLARKLLRSLEFRAPGMAGWGPTGRRGAQRPTASMMMLKPRRLSGQRDVWRRPGWNFFLITGITGVP